MLWGDGLTDEYPGRADSVVRDGSQIEGEPDNIAPTYDPSQRVRPSWPMQEKEVPMFREFRRTKLKPNVKKTGRTNCRTLALGL